MIIRKVSISRNRDTVFWKGFLSKNYWMVFRLGIDCLQTGIAEESLLDNSSHTCLLVCLLLTVYSVVC